MILKRLFCKHKNLEFLGNVYGDLIHTVSTWRRINRSAWLCKDCGKIIFSEDFGPMDHESYNHWLWRMQDEARISK